MQNALDPFEWTIARSLRRRRLFVKMASSITIRHLIEWSSLIVTVWIAVFLGLW